MLSGKSLLNHVAGGVLAVSLVAPALSYGWTSSSSSSSSSGEWKCEGGSLLVNVDGTYTDGSSAVTEELWNSIGTGYSYSYFQSAYSDAAKILCSNTADAKTNQMRVSTTQTVGLISQRAAGTVRALRGPRNTANLLDGQLTGMAAGGSAAKTGLWANFDHTRADDRAAGSDTKLNNFVLGGDHKLTDKLAVGASVSYQDSTLSVASTDFDSTAWTVAPYAAYLINDNMSADFVAGYTWLKNKQPGGTSYDTNRYFVASNLNAFTTNLDKWEVGGHTGFMFVKDKVDGVGGAEKNDISFLQAKTGIETSYFATKSVQPYLNMDYEQDLVYEADQSTYDDTGFVTGMGVRVDMPANLLGDLHLSKTYGRRNFDQDSITANVRMNF
ncbi:MAG: autotransporter outer membrane beta-barrel domain-containing protein [Magnetococcales bacterium]|nr:autotransporter outer membrane beta-barrel domain-containing protein [Magnetococcales bacterium]